MGMCACVCECVAAGTTHTCITQITTLIDEFIAPRAARLFGASVEDLQSDPFSNHFRRERMYFEAVDISQWRLVVPLLVTLTSYAALRKCMPTIEYLYGRYSGKYLLPGAKKRVHAHTHSHSHAYARTLRMVGYSWCSACVLCASDGVIG